MYIPDYWIVIKITKPDDFVYKVYANWGGTYTSGEYWKLNSGITHVERDGDYYLFHGHSGSVYKCHVRSYGCNAYGNSVLQGWMNDTSDDFKIDVIPENTDWINFDYNRKDL